MTQSEQHNRVAEQICDRYPMNKVNVRLTHPIPTGDVCDAVVCLGSKTLATHRVHYDPKGTITAADPPLPQRAA